jgi:chemotaxis protein methyltransferase CheR
MMTEDSLSRFYALLQEHTGIALDATKQYLIESRLSPLGRKMGYSDVYSFIKYLMQRPIEQIHWEAFESLTTNETSFFRDKHVFDALETTILPGLIASRREVKTLRIWSSAVAAGQEAYSLAILIRERFPELLSWNISIQATDISINILDRARIGMYNAVEVNRGLERSYIEKYFVKQNDTYRVNSEIRAMINFSPLNLIGQWPPFERFDLIMLRNVLIYFNSETKNRVLEKMHSKLSRDFGVLLLGATESILANSLYQTVPLQRCSYYKAS